MNEIMSMASAAIGKERNVSMFEAYNGMPSGI